MIKSALFSVVPSGPWGLATVSFWASDQERQASSQVALSCGYFVHPRCHAGELLQDRGQAYCAVLVYNMDREGSCVCGVTGGGGVFASLSFPILCRIEVA